MIATFVKYRGHRCFTKDFAGFETVKPVNVIIGRNNTGKSHLIDFAEALCADKVLSESKGWECQCKGVLETEDLRRVFVPGHSGGELEGDHWLKHGHLFNGRVVSWTVNNQGKVTNIELPDVDGFTPPSHPVAQVRTGFIELILRNTKPPLSGKRFCRLVADRDIQPEPAKQQLAVQANGVGATNLIRRYLLSSNQHFDDAMIRGEMLAALNKIFVGDGEFNDIQVKAHDDHIIDSAQGPSWEVFLEEKHKGLVRLTHSGSGLKTVILVLLNLLVWPHCEKSAPGDYVFALEELENNLHPAALRRLFQYLEDFAVEKKTTVFLTTHSSVALDMFGVSEHAQIIRVSHDGESARAEAVSAHFERQGILSELGAKPSDLLQANGIIWVEGPSDRIYLNRWIELFSGGSLREGRNYQCAFYGGSLLAQTEFASPEESNTDLVNLLRLNHNIIVVCDSDRTASMDGESSLKERVKRIEEEVRRIPRAHIWITEAKEIENYLPGQALTEVFEAGVIPDPGQYERFFPSESTNAPLSFVQMHLKRKTIDKVDLAMQIAPHMTREMLEKRFDLADQLRNIVKMIQSWN